MYVTFTQINKILTFLLVNTLIVNKNNIKIAKQNSIFL